MMIIIIIIIIIIIKKLFAYVPEILSTFNLSDIASKIRIVTIFVITKL
jgi:hypothetical protein